MKVKVHTPAEGHTGTVAGVDFVDGVAETDDAAALFYFRRRGYRVEDPPAAPKPRPLAKSNDDE